MNSEALDNLVKARVLEAEPPDQAEFDGLLKLGANRLKDAHNEDQFPREQIDLAYNAAHRSRSQPCVGTAIVRIVNGSSCFRPCNTR